MGNLQRTKSSVETCFHSTEYQLVEKIGEGGFGQVYKAQQHSTGKYVAIKFLILSDDFSVSKKDRYISRFHRESELISRLNHPNIVTLIDKGQQGDYLIYAVYEYIEGETLQQHLQTHGALNACLAAEIMSCVLDALAHAHQKGVIHRDIKPANIMLYQVGAKTHVKVLDFGIGTLKNEARQLDYKSITLTQETLGTPTYSAPEQLRGEPPLPQTDIYVWGLVFLECLTGVPTFTGTSLASIFHQQLSQANVPLGVLAGHSSANFFRRVLNKRPLQRPSDTAKLYHEFMGFNFSNLVGVLEEPLPSNANLKLNSQVHDETLITDGPISFSRLAERKQIVALALIISSNGAEFSHVSAVDQDIVDMLHRDQMQQCIDIAVRYGASHVGTLGDTLLFYFGYPHVTDNDSRLCSRAALEIASNVTNKNALLKQRHTIETRVRMGIDTGLMMTISDSAPEGKVAHSAMNLARKAKYGQIVCTEQVHATLDSYAYFDGYLFDNQTRRTSDEDAKAYYLLRGERQSEAFGFLRGRRKHSAFVGRETELAELKQSVSISSQSVVGHSVGAKGLIHLLGGPGIGKSRLIIELREQIKERRCFIGQCLPEHRNNALYPILLMVKHKFSLTGLTEEQSLYRLERAIAETSLDHKHAKQALLVLSAWLGLPLEGLEPLSGLSPELQKARLFEVLRLLLCQVDRRMAKQGGSHHLFILEDIHWIDPTSKTFILDLVQSDAFIKSDHAWVNTSRNSAPQSLAALSKTTITLSKLSQEQTRTFINDLFDNQPLANALLALLIERTDGIPLFAEELVSSLRKQKLVHRVNGVVDFIDKDRQHLVPITLRASLQQQLEHLSFAKDTVQLAACIGRSFDYQLLVAASDKDEAQVQTDLNELLNAELIFLQRKVDGDSYIFKHALIRDAAYESQLGDKRLSKHKAIASALQKSGQGAADYHAISLHFFHAEMHAQAIPYLLDYGETKLSQSAISDVLEVVKMLDDCFERSLTESNHSQQQRAKKLKAVSELSVSGYGARSVVDEIALFTDITDDSVSATFADQNYLFSNFLKFQDLLFNGYPDRAMELVLDIIKGLEGESLRLAIVMYGPLIGNIMMLKGEFKNSEKIWATVLELYSQEKDIHLHTETGADPKVTTLYTWALQDSLSGNYTLSSKKLEESKIHAKLVGSSLSLDLAIHFEFLISVYTKNHKRIVSISSEYYDSFTSQNENEWIVFGSNMIYEWNQGNVSSLSEYIEEQISLGRVCVISTYEYMLAVKLLRMKNLSDCINVCEEALSKMKSMGLTWNTMFIYSIKLSAIYRMTRSVSGVYQSELCKAILQSSRESEWPGIFEVVYQHCLILYSLGKRYELVRFVRENVRLDAFSLDTVTSKKLRKLYLRSL
ncbi:TOMM system kinase/cyclase fusion protein [Vibrio nomapromontoriensis]|uniref:TOMM system kinase/cyclase fusion protein n=1 Tax=Vibrio nomapromontoriensis TaxID=2910246 RepID=UPI003D0EF018